jgi:hypothetical protein
MSRNPYDYYEAPKTPSLSDFDEFGQPRRPGVVTWFKVYAGFMGAMYGLIMLFCVLGVIGIMVAPPEDMGSDDKALMWVMMPVMLIVCAALAGVFLAAIFLPRKPWVWVYDIVLIALGLSSPCLWPATIPLIIFWVKQDNRLYFGQAKG